MDRKKLKAVLLGLVCFCFGLLIANRIQFENPILDWIFAGLGIAALLIHSFLLYKTKGVFPHLFIGIILTIIAFIIFYFFWEPYPMIAGILFPLTIFISLVFLIIGTIKMSKALFDELRKN